MRQLLADKRLFAAAFLALFLAVDWLSFFHEPPAINITPWNPPAGLYIALLLACPRAAPLAFAALMLGDVVVRGIPAPLWILILTNLLIAAAYAGGAWLLRTRVGLHPALDRLSDLVWLMGAVVMGAVPVAAAFAVPHAAAGLLPWHDLPSVILQYWVGDVIGILGVAPALLTHIHRSAPLGPRPTAFETAMHALAVAAGLLATFNPWVPDPSKVFYVLFLPVIWIALRRGLPGASIAILTTQLGLVIGLQVGQHQHWDDLTYYQMLMVALAATGLLVGAVVSERWRLEARLRERQAELARVGRLSLLGEMASSLAHELNQPLFTTIGYTKTSRQLLLRGGPPEEIADLMNRAVAEAERAADVLRSIRGFLRQGESAKRVKLADAVEGILALARPDVRRKGINVSVTLPPDLPDLWMVPVQLDQVLLNLIRNSIDALVSMAREQGGEIRISALAKGSMVEISVEDDGPGVPEDKIGPLFDLFFTTKPSGMGLGLPISRSIVEAHGGKLWLARNGAGGACFSFTVPAAGP